MIRWRSSQCQFCLWRLPWRRAICPRVARWVSIRWLPWDTS